MSDELKIFRIEDGGERFWYAARAKKDALLMWRIEYDISDDDGPRRIVRVQLKDATLVEIEDIDGFETKPCGRCGGTGRMPIKRSLLEWFHRAVEVGKPTCLGATVY